VLALSLRKKDLLVAATATGAAVDIVCMLDSVARPLGVIYCHINTTGTYTTKLMLGITKYIIVLQGCKYIQL
jgi:hypothetical protein